MIATETYTPLVNGPTVFTERLATGLAHRGHDVVVAAPSPNGHRFVEEPSRGLTICRVRSIPTPYPQQRCALLTRGDADGLLTDFHPDLVHIQNLSFATTPSGPLRDYSGIFRQTLRHGGENRGRVSKLTSAPSDRPHHVERRIAP